MTNFHPMNNPEAELSEYQMEKIVISDPKDLGIQPQSFRPPKQTRRRIKKTDPDTFLYASREKVVVCSEPVPQK